jgi:L-lactate dehydrogenase complex protein LldG
VDRDAFLTKVGRAAMGAQLPDPPQVATDLPELGEADLLSLFRSRAMEVSTVVHGPMSRHGVPRVIAGIASGHDAGSFMAWDQLPVNGVAAALSSGGLTRLTPEAPWGEERREHQAGMYHLDLGVTGAQAALAESGSIVLLHGPGRPRMASLIPETHVAILEVGLVARSLAHWAHQYPGSPRSTANLVVITGPSRTADIELQLNLGVHGPRHLHVVLVN